MNISKILRFNIKSKRFFTTKPTDWSESYPTKQENIKNHGKNLYYPKYGSSFWEPNKFTMSSKIPNTLTLASNNGQDSYFSKRDITSSDMNSEEYRKKFLDVEDQLWCSDENTGKKLFKPKNGNSFYDSQKYK